MKAFLIALLALILLSCLTSAQVPANGSDVPRVGEEDKTRATPAPDSLDLRPDEKGRLSEEQMRNLLRVTADHDVENDKRQRDYTYIEREEQHNLDGKG